MVSRSVRDVPRDEERFQEMGISSFFIHLYWQEDMGCQSD